MARPSGVHLTMVRGTDRAMPRKPMSTLQTQVSTRLRAIQDELGLNDGAMALSLGVGRTRWGNWVAGENMPEESVMVRLCDAIGVTMDWIYRGRTSGIDAGLLIRLELRCAGTTPEQAPPELYGQVAARLAAA